MKARESNRARPERVLKSTSEKERAAALLLHKARDPACLDTERRRLEPWMQLLCFEMADVQIESGRAGQQPAVSG
jgi:hypothetical protein